MGRAYSQDLRERVMAAVESGTGAYAAASIFQVSVSYIYKALGRRRTTGETRARPWNASCRRRRRLAELNRHASLLCAFSHFLSYETVPRVKHCKFRQIAMI